MQEWKITPLTDWVNQNLFINQLRNKINGYQPPNMSIISVNNHLDKKFIVCQTVNSFCFIYNNPWSRETIRMLKPHRWLDVGGNQSAWRKPLKSGWDPLKPSPGRTLVVEEGGMIHFTRLTLLLWGVCRRNCQFHDVLYAYIYLQLDNKERVY